MGDLPPTETQSAPAAPTEMGEPLLDDLVEESDLGAIRDNSGSLYVTLTDAKEHGWRKDMPAYVKVLVDGRIVIEPYDYGDLRETE